jgi:hypothetical protein
MQQTNVPAARPAPAPPPARAKPTILTKRGRIASPPRVLIYGPEGVGKSTLAADAPKSVLGDAEAGSKHLDVERYYFRPGEPETGYILRSYQELLDACDALLVADHDFGSFVIDPISRVEALLWRHILDRDGKRSSRKKDGELDSIEDYGYGKGYQFALDEWRNLCEKLDRLNSQRRMTIVLVDHATVRTFKNPEGEDFDRYNLRVHEKTAAFLREWVDVLGFFTYETVVDSERDRRGKRIGRPKGLSTGRRVLRVTRTAAYDAKSRIPLPEEIEVTESSPWRPIAEAIAAGQEMTSEQIVGQIQAECARIGDAAVTEKVRAAVEAKPDLATLYRYLNSLRDRPAAEQP